MFRYTLRRLYLFIITLLVLTLVGYNIIRLDTEAPWHYMSFVSGWFSYLAELSQLNFGVNYQGTPILNDLLVVFPATLELCIIAFTIALVVGIPVGTLAGMRQGKVIDTVISFISMSGYSAPLYWVALLMIMFFSLHLELLPVSGRIDLLYEVKHITGFATIDAFLSEGEFRSSAIQSVIEHLVLPCFVLALAPLTQIVRLMRASVAEVMAQNYIRVARIKGLSKYEIVLEHVLRNALPPIIPQFGIQLSSMFAFSIITESIFNWPGIGRWLLNALANQDYASIQAGVIVVATFVLTANIFTDLLGTLANPLVRKDWYANK